MVTTNGNTTITTSFQAEILYNFLQMDRTKYKLFALRRAQMLFEKKMHEMDGARIFSNCKKQAITFFSSFQEGKNCGGRCIMGLSYCGISMFDLTISSRGVNKLRFVYTT